MAESLLDIIFRTKKTGSGDKETLTGVAAMKQEFQDLTGISLTTAGVMAALGGAVYAVGKAAVDTVNEYSSYVEQVDKISMATGMASEETSRLIQLADDFRVEVGSLQGAMKMALQNGFQPTVENLANLSDQYLSMSSATERAAMLQKIFGKQWESMVPLLERGGKAIREASSGISEGLVVTQQAIEVNRQYQKAVDDLGDSWTAFKFALTEEALPAIANYLSYSAQAIQAVTTEGNSVAGLAGNYGGLAIQMQQAKTAGYDWNDAAREGMRVHQEYATATTVANTEMRYFAQNIAEGAAKARSLAEAEVALANAQTQLSAAQANWKAGAGGQFASDLEAAGLKGDELYAALAAVDEKMNTNTAHTKMQEDAIKALVDQFARDKDLNKFKTGIDGITSGFMPFDKSVEDATALVQTLLEKIDAFVGTHTATLRIRVDDQSGGAGGGGAGGGGGGGGGSNCFLAGTPVTTPEGMRPIEEIRVGEYVSVLQEDGQIVSAQVFLRNASQRNDLVTVTLSDGQAITCSPNHPWKLWRPREHMTLSASPAETGGRAAWAWASALKPGTLLVSDHGDVHVVEVNPYPGEHVIYNFTISHKEHTFMVGGVVVHNVQAKAAGGPVMAGEMYYVGDKGIELLQLAPAGNRAGKVIPNDQVAGAAGMTVNVGNINNGMDLEELIWTIEQRILKR